jgi:CRISPR/Cas system-associated exonuclease Cas4 (RecB family)
MRRRPKNNDIRTIRASELGDYSYCSRAWWYRHVLKISPPSTEALSRLQEGTIAHQAHGRSVALSTTLRALGIALALLGLLTLIVALVTR